jgi:MoxR-like ATPase
MTYQPLFEAPKDQTSLGPAERAPGDLDDGAVYVYDPDIEMAVNVALATARPLLISGPPGSGKSSLAPNVAKVKGWRYIRQTISTRLEARDLEWTTDPVQRLGDAQVKELKSREWYIRPGPLWQALDPRGAARYGPQIESPAAPDERRAVVLLDEIDKADPDVPNDLLVPLGSFTFKVPELDQVVKLQVEPPLIVLTTNDERELSRPFVRRCVVLTLEPPNRKRLLDIAKKHFGDAPEQLLTDVADALERMEVPAGSAPPSTAEYLDAVNACLKLGVTPGSDQWAKIESITLRKPVAPRL